MSPKEREKKLKSMSIMDFINTVGVMEDEENRLTKSRFKEIRNSEDENALAEAIEAMEAAGGYDALEDD